MEWLATALALAQHDAGFTVGPERVADRTLCDELVESGHLEAVEEVEGGFMLSRGLAEAVGAEIGRRARQAEQN
jgi:hypothetical protein